MVVSITSTNYSQRIKLLKCFQFIIEQELKTELFKSLKQIAELNEEERQGILKMGELKKELDLYEKHSNLDIQSL